MQNYCFIPRKLNLRFLEKIIAIYSKHPNPRAVNTGAIHYLHFGYFCAGVALFCVEITAILCSIVFWIDQS